MDALVVCTVAFVSATLVFYYGALIVVRWVTRRRWAATQRVLQQARGVSEAIPPRFSIRAAVLPMLGGAGIGGVIVLSTYLYVAHQSRPAFILGLGILLLVVGRLRRTWATVAADDDDEGEDWARL